MFKKKLSQRASGNRVGQNCDNRRGHHGLLLRIVIIIFYSCCFVVMSFLLSILLLYMGGFYIFLKLLQVQVLIDITYHC